MLKRLTALLICVLMLAALFGCGQVTRPPVDPSPTPTNTVTPTPEPPTREPEPTGTPEPTETPEPTPSPEVTPPPGVIHTVDGYEIVYENEELGVAICSVDKGSHIVVHYGDLTQEIENFPYNDMRPDFEVWEQDGDNDGTNELYVIHTTGSGTGVSVQKLLVCKPNGGELDCLVHDWSEIAEQFRLNRVASYDPVTGLVSVIYGERAVAVVTDSGLNCENPAAIFGNQVHYFRSEDGTVGMTFALELTGEDHPMTEFYGMSLFLSLQFDGTDMVPVTEPQLGLDYGARFAFSVTPTHVHQEYPESWYGEFLLSTPVGDRSFSGLQLMEDISRMELHLADLTGDGAEEYIVMLLPGYGTGPVKHDLHIFDGVTLEEYDVGGVWSLLSEATTFASDGRHYYIDAANLLVSVSKEDAQNELADVLDALGQAKLLDTMEFFSVHSRLSASGGKLFLSNECVVINPWYSYGTLTASLVIKEGHLTIDEIFYTAPDGTVVKERQVKDYFHNLLHNGSVENWYLAAMGSIYESPAELDLGLVFYSGFAGREEISPAEKAYLLEQGFSDQIAMQKLPANQLDEILNSYFGISLYDVAIPADWVYYPETDCYYSNHNDAYMVHGFTLVDIRETEDDLFELHYYVDPIHGAFDPVTGWPVVYGILTLRPNGNSLIGPEGFTVVSNVAAQPIDALIEEGVFLYALPDGQLIMQDGYVAGPVTYVNDTNADHPSCYDLSLITITRKEFLYDWEGEPLYGVILLNLLSGEPTENVELRWVEETGTWEVSFRASNQPDLPGEMVTSQTLPTNPKEFYLVGELPHEHLWLYSRNYGQDSLLVWEGNFWWYLEGRIAHSTQFNLPRLNHLGNSTYAVISEVQTGTQTGVEELVVYDILPDLEVDASHYTGIRDYVYDWRGVAEEFNRNNTIVYDKDTNSIVLYWNDEVYFTGTLPEDQSAYLGLEDGFTGALVASGQIVRYKANEDGSFTVTMETCIGRGGDGYFSDDLSDPFWYWNGEENRYYPLSVGTVGFELNWTVNFTGEGFDVSDVAVNQTGSNHILLRAAIPARGIYLFCQPTDIGGKHYLLADGQIHAIEPDIHWGDLIADFRLCDLDGDGEDEIAAVGNHYAGSSTFSQLIVLDRKEDGWTLCRLDAGSVEEYTLPYEPGSALFTTGIDPHIVTVHLAGYSFQFSVNDEVAARQGEYYVYNTALNRTITWGEDGFYLHLPNLVYRSGSDRVGWDADDCGVAFELRCKLEYDGNTIAQIPIGITPPYSYFTVTERGSGLFELVSEQGVVLFNGFHLPGEEILTYRRDLDLDGAEEFIVLLASGRNDTTVHHDAYVFDGRTMEQVDTSGLASIGMSLFVFFSDDEMFHIHSGEYRQPLYKKDILALYPDIEFLDKVEFWGERSSLAVMYDYIEVSYDCIVGEGGESYGSLRVHLKLEDGQLVPYRIEYVSVEGRYSRYQLASNPMPGPFIVE